jgi:peptide/nickel transport system ATP-binding protein
VLPDSGSTGPGSQPVLSVRDLVIDAVSDEGRERIVDHVSFDVMAGSVFGIVGESGSGKTLTMLAVMGLLPNNLRVAGGEVWLEGRNLLTLSAEDLRKIRGGRLAMIFQDPMTSLNPVINVGKQIGEIIEIHNPSLSRGARKDRVVELLSLVGIPDPGRRYKQFPHEFSGGMRQRAMIAMAVANAPTLLIADEPTTALDVTIQAQVMEILAEVRERTNTSMVLVTHDLGLVAESADEIGVMYGGRMMERASVADVFANPSHPYTVGLFNSLPRIDAELDELYSIAGQPPTVGAYPSGCVFHPRCGLSEGRPACASNEPALVSVTQGHLAACHFIEEVTPWAARVAAAALGRSK